MLLGYIAPSGLPLISNRWCNTKKMPLRCS